MPCRRPTPVLASAAALMLAVSGLSCGSGSGRNAAPVPKSGVSSANASVSAPVPSAPPAPAPAAPAPAPASELVGPPFRPGSDNASALDSSAVLDALERQITEGVARARESAVALEYSADSGDRRRPAEGVRGSSSAARRRDLGPDRRPFERASSAPIVARVASGRRLTAQWVAADDETGLTLLKIPPNHARPATRARPGGTRARRDSRAGDRQPVRAGRTFGRPGIHRRPEPSAGAGARLPATRGLIEIDASLRPGETAARSWPTFAAAGSA